MLFEAVLDEFVAFAAIVDSPDIHADVLHQLPRPIMLGPVCTEHRGWPPRDTKGTWDRVWDRYDSGNRTLRVFNRL